MKFQKTFTVEISDEQFNELVNDLDYNKSEAENILKNKVEFFSDYLSDINLNDLYLAEFFDTSVSSWEKID